MGRREVERGTKTCHAILPAFAVWLCGEVNKKLTILWYNVREKSACDGKIMKKSFVLAMSLSSIVAYGADDFDIGDVKVKCDCDKDKKEWTTEKIDPEWTRKLGTIPPVIPIGQEKKG
jgi:hypothetical protein